MNFFRLLDQIYRLSAVQMTGIKDAVAWTPLQPVGDAWSEFAIVEYAPGRYTSGFACDRSRRLVCLKALMEALENVALLDSGLTLNNRSGLAASFDPSEAEQRAYAELIERDAFLFHWITETSGARYTLQNPQYFAEAELPRAVRLSSADPNLQVVMVGSRSKAYGCWHFGMSVAADPERAAEKALMEWTASIFAHRHAAGCPGEKLRANPESNQKTLMLEGHHENSKNEAVSKLLEHVLWGTPELSPLPSGFALPSTQFDRLKTRTPKYAVVYAKNEYLLPMLFGEMFENHFEQYLLNPRVQRMRGDSPFRFHGEKALLKHPFN